ncbi:hypothetical protein [Paenibacillus oryzisoli]|uniref:HTH araC/xylS-type domain-containing protein n=1 Tax=Paenibacillus oryzisoli TaxID=1850517 RepID=A0A198AED0_9BACL|nr:hypothetical protein [Paenibacillus oryzisoli]OAS19298.1 hypothetical protein A8708_26685 [Paenibacillus oryzisoli]
MNQVELDSMLKVYSEDEILFCKYYDAKKNRNTFQVLTDNLDMGLIKEIKEEDYFSSSDRTDIFILKHKRFTPIFKHRINKENYHVHHFTESYLSKLIKETSGQTFLDIIKTIKLNKTIELLTSSDESILKIILIL